MTDVVTLAARAPDADAFAPFGAFLEPPAEIGGRAMFSDWLEPVEGRAQHYHLNKAPTTSLPVVVERVECHPHAAQLFLPVGVSRYLVTVMPSDEVGAPDPTRALAFVVPGTMGVAYHAGTWHAGISVLDGGASFAVMMWRGGDDDDDVFASITPTEVRAADSSVGSGERG